MDYASDVLITRKPKRLFTFGCSFSNYIWGGMWPEIIAYDLNIPFYNYGKSGAGNQYMICMLAQADIFYKFNSDDLIIIQWTNVCREDKYVNGVWHTPGNIFTQNVYDDRYVAKWADPEGYLLRDLTSINFVDSFLESKGCQYHFLSMVDIVSRFNQWSDENKTYKSITDIFSHVPPKIHKSFYDVLWNGSISVKKERDLDLIGNRFFDGHPHPAESLKYLQEVFSGHTFNGKTIRTLQELQQKWIFKMKKYYNKARDYEYEIKQATTIYPNIPVEGIIH